MQALRGFRDYYPDDQAKITFLRDTIKSVCDLFGYEEFEGPAVEPIELYAAKSSEEIVKEQAFTFADRGGENITLRPELTPTLARMIAAKQNQLTFPVRWWSWGRFWRYERPQKGRGREFYQWNCDLLGDDSLEADVEMLEIVIRFLSSLGLTAKDCVIEVSDRSMINSMLAQSGLSSDDMPQAFRYLDKASKLSADERTAFAAELGIEAAQTTLDDLTSETTPALASDSRLSEIINIMKAKGLNEWIRPNLAIVRGFAYYTGLVFEVSDRAKTFRALLGGGRYANLVSDVGGQPLSGIGFGAGDMVLLLFLGEKGLLPAYTPQPTACVIGLDANNREYYHATLGALRHAGINTLGYGITDNLGKGLKYASTKGARYAIFVGDDERLNQTVTWKNLATGEQKTETITKCINEFKNRPE